MIRKNKRREGNRNEEWRKGERKGIRGGRNKEEKREEGMKGRREKGKE